MKVILAEKYGFCAGVRNAISTAEKVLAEKGRVFSLGPIIHNPDVVERLAKKGLVTVDNVEQVPVGATVLIRSHGAASEEIAHLKQKNVDIIDATCVLVKRMQQIAAQMEREGYKVVIVGDKNHPEVRAVLGCTSNAVVVGIEPDISKIGSGRLGIVCQTTQSPEFFGRMLSAIAGAGFDEMKVVNTLCKEAIKRQQAAVELCMKVDIMFVLGGLESANTRKLAELCKKYNNRTFHLQNWDEFDKKQVFGPASSNGCAGQAAKTASGEQSRTAGVTAGASTPQWIIDDFVKNLSEIDIG